MAQFFAEIPRAPQCNQSIVLVALFHENRESVIEIDLLSQILIITFEIFFQTESKPLFREQSLEKVDFEAFLKFCWVEIGRKLIKTRLLERREERVSKPAIFGEPVLLER